MLNSRNPDSAWRGMGLPYIETYGQLMMAMYLKISVSDFLTVFSARCRGPFFERRPGAALTSEGARCCSGGVKPLPRTTPSLRRRLLKFSALSAAGVAGVSRPRRNK